MHNLNWSEDKHLYLIKYPPEIGTKKRHTRLKFIERLKANIIAAINEKTHLQKDEWSIKEDWNQIQVISEEPLIELLTHLPGIKVVAPAKKVNVIAKDDLLQNAYEHFRPLMQSHLTFAVRARKTTRKDISTRKVEKELGTWLNEFSEVNLDKPDLKFRIEIRGNEAFFYHTRYAGLEGLPVGVEGKALTLMGGGIDSPVASWYIYRAGVDQDFLYFDLDGGEIVKEKAYAVADKLRNEYAPGSPGKLVYLNFLPVIQEIMKVNGSFRNLVLKYCFYKVGERLARIKKAEALVTGESLGQVSTQTLKNLRLLDGYTHMLILRPLSTFMKDEIKSKASEIGTFQYSYTGKEYCALESKQVETSSTPAKLEKELQKMDLSVLEKVISERQEHPIGELAQMVSSPKKQDQPKSEELLPADHEIIDLRTDQEAQEKPVPRAKVIPFQQAWTDFFHWSPDKSYFLVCGVGSKSKILADFMQEQGFSVDHLEGGVKAFYQKTEKSNPTE